VLQKVNVTIDPREFRVHGVESSINRFESSVHPFAKALECLAKHCELALQLLEQNRHFARKWGHALARCCRLFFLRRRHGARNVTP
jgi:hypothetical protein